MFAVSERAIKYLIKNCKLKAKLAITNLREETICSAVSIFIGCRGKDIVRNAK